MNRGFAFTDAEYNAAMDAAARAYSLAGGNDSQRAIAEYREAKSKAMREAAKRYAASLKA